MKLRVTSIKKQSRMCMDSNPEPKENWGSTEAPTPNTAATITTPARGWNRLRKAVGAEIAMGDSRCFHVSTTITHETKVTVLDTISCFLEIPAKQYKSMELLLRS